MPSDILGCEHEYPVLDLQYTKASLSNGCSPIEGMASSQGIITGVTRLGYTAASGDRGRSQTGHSNVVGSV